MNEELEQVEIKVSYLEAQVAELNEVVIEQQKNIDAMNIKLLQVTKKLEELIEEVGSPSRPNRKPPHYENESLLFHSVMASKTSSLEPSSLILSILK